LLIAAARTVARAVRCAGRTGHGTGRLVRARDSARLQPAPAVSAPESRRGLPWKAVISTGIP